MKILFLTKRRPMGKDLLTRPYGRFYYLPYWLSQLGHDVTILALSYKRDEPVHTEQNGLTWFSESVVPWGPVKYIQKANQLIKSEEIDCVVGFSDTFYGILAERLASKHQIYSAIDAYDNYESYISWLKPLHWIWRRSLSKTHLLTAAGKELGKLMVQNNVAHNHLKIVPMAADPEFRPMDKEACRKHLGLPLDKTIIGYSGGLNSNRGIEFLNDIIESYEHRDDIVFVASGRCSSNVEIHNSIQWLGYLADEDMPCLMNAYDLLLVINKPSAFGNYSYPIKLYEAMACQLPVIVADVPGSRSVLKEHTQFLAKPLDIKDFTNKINQALAHETYDYKLRNTWQDNCKIFEEGLLHLEQWNR